MTQQRKAVKRLAKEARRAHAVSAHHAEAVKEKMIRGHTCPRKAERVLLHIITAPKGMFRHHFQEEAWKEYAKNPSIAGLLRIARHSRAHGHAAIRMLSHKLSPEELKKIRKSLPRYKRDITGYLEHKRRRDS